jgi:DNA-binding transcriptional LysR family regulator
MHLLRAFIATSELKTVSAAVDALHLTQGAVSRQVLELEGWLGVALFARVRKRLQLTPAGQRYLLALQPLVRQLEAATLDLMSNPHGGGVLHLSALPTFATKWLIPRLPAFQAAHPKVALQFVPYVQGYDFQRPDLDCAIRYGEGPWEGAVCEYVIGRRMVLIAPPPRQRGAALRRPADVAGHRLLHHLTVPRAWSDWCARHGVSDVHPHGGIQLDQYAAIVRAVAAGMGIALVPECLVEDELARGEVVTPLPPRQGVHEASAGYFLCFPENRASIDALMVFKTWLQEVASAPPAPGTAARSGRDVPGRSAGRHRRLGGR